MSIGSRLKWRNGDFNRQATINIWNEIGHVCTSKHQLMKRKIKFGEGMKTKTCDLAEYKNFALLKSIVNHSAAIRKRSRVQVPKMAR